MPDRLLVAILAAGASRRLGQPKQLVTVDGEPLLRRQCRMALEAAVGPVVAILGCRATECASTISDLLLTVRINESWNEGIAASLREAATVALEYDVAGLLILHGDQYRLTPDDLRKIQTTWERAGRATACRAVNEKYVGPPVIFPRKWFPQLLTLNGDEGARVVLRQMDVGSIIDVAMPTAVWDLDVPLDLLVADRLLQ
jgi:molybdenum cofactor cytidylyltransferase